MTRLLRLGTLPALLSAVGACTPPPEPGSPPVSEAVANLAAPGQDLTTARLVPEDGCYWYMHQGPVETTLIPLRTVRGARICIPKEANPANPA